ncbi:MAG: hypothetical protein NTV52_32390 [Acidobacteria bacterium]|nr:hypothetical protein [Acidobacteriota bacterium]
MTALRDATADLGEDLNVTQFPAPDFNRTYIFNGEGSDHGWGSHRSWWVGRYAARVCTAVIRRWP